MKDTINALRDKLLADPTGASLSGHHFSACPPASEQAVAAAETALGFGLPPILREIYLSVANGGFGPGYGVMGVDGGFTDDRGGTILSRYKSFRLTDPHDPTWLWDASWLPFCHWGCGIYSVVSGVAPYPVLVVDPGNKDEGEPMESVVHPHKARFEDWIRGWLVGNDLWGETWG